MVVLTVSKKVAICFDPKCMSLDGDERSKRDSEIYASVSRMLSTMTKKFHRYVVECMTLTMVIIGCPRHFCFNRGPSVMVWLFVGIS